MSLFVGTSGWAYKEWKPDFYPEDLPQRRFLEHYSSVLSACEVNATFYRLQSDDTFKRWIEGVPEGFRFTTKAHRRLTHSRDIVPEGETKTFLDNYLRSVGVLGDRLGVILFQYPPYRSRDDGLLAAVMDALPQSPAFAFEFRHESWDSHEVREQIAERGATVCVSNTDGTVPGALPPGPLAYVRLRTDRYGEEERAAWRSLLEREAGSRPVYAFTKHEGIPAGDPYGGIGLATWLCSHGI